ncbi:hypothetical protein SCHPADRAFT_926304 [Schizopora paradoxa]|uniref:MYND-type domain-containing protein n=1 Tax=Schizopora paradoxa TaxID=27342 RepID=A0A0H2S4Z6_9AGAM|nr:hypothetical protein SCHPADRAFT_926304 [Schizopora paradoxa]
MPDNDKWNNPGSFDEQLRDSDDVSERWRTNAKQLIKEVEEDNNTFKLATIVNQGIESDETWPAYRDGGVVDLLVKLVCERPDHKPNVPEYIAPPWNFPMLGLQNISNRTIISNEEHPKYFEEWDGPTNSKLKASLGKMLRRVLRDGRLKYQEPRQDVAAFLFPFLKAGDAQWIQSIPEILEFVWKSWAMDSLGDSQEQRDFFSRQLHYTLCKLYPNEENRTAPEKPPITTEEALKRALSLLKPIPLETARNTRIHIDAIGTICRLYPDMARAFLEGGVLAQSVKAIGARAFAPGNLAPESPREFPNSNDWDDEINKHYNSILTFWVALLRSGDFKTNKKDEKAISAVSKALDAEFIDRLAFISLRVRNEEGIESTKTMLSLLHGDYAPKDIVLARQMIQKQVYIIPRMDGFSKDDSAPAMIQPVGLAWIRHLDDMESIISKGLRACAWEDCKSGESSPAATPSLRCSKCKSAVYCNADCQKSDWPSHKKSCKKLPV